MEQAILDVLTRAIIRSEIDVEFVANHILAMEQPNTVHHVQTAPVLQVDKYVIAQ